MPAELHDQEFELSGPLIVSLSHLIPQHLTLTRARGYRQSYRERERETERSVLSTEEAVGRA